MILCIVEKNFMGEHSGIGTFVRNLKSTFPTNVLVYECSKNCEEDFDKDLYANDISNIEEILDVNANISCILSNALYSLKLANEFSKTNKVIYYTHIGDLLHESSVEFFDFGLQYVKSLHYTLLENKNIIIGTQTEELKNLIQTKYENEVVVLPEPLGDKELSGINIKNQKKSIIIVAGNYKRKRYDKMLKLVGKVGLPVTIVCANYEFGYYDISKLIVENNIKEINIIKKISNKNLIKLISTHSLLLHISEIEVLPYVLLESAHNVPCYINKTTEWGINAMGIFNDVEALSASNIDVDYTERFNASEYRKTTIKKWGDMISDGI